MAKKSFKFLLTEKSQDFYQQMEYKLLANENKFKPEDFNLYQELFKKGTTPSTKAFEEQIKALGNIPTSMLPTEIQNYIELYAKTKVGKGIIIYEHLNDLDKYISPYLTKVDVLVLLIQQDFSNLYSPSVLNAQINIEKIMEQMKQNTMDKYKEMNEKCYVALPTDGGDYMPIKQYIDRLQSFLSQAPEKLKKLRYQFPGVILDISPQAPTPLNICKQLSMHCDILDGLGIYYQDLQDYLQSRCGKK